MIYDIGGSTVDVAVCGQCVRDIIAAIVVRHHIVQAVTSNEHKRIGIASTFFFDFGVSNHEFDFLLFKVAVTNGATHSKLAHNAFVDNKTASLTNALDLVGSIGLMIDTEHKGVTRSAKHSP